MSAWTPKVNYDTGPTTFTMTSWPVNDPLNEEREANVSEVESNTGAYQCQYNFTKKRFTVDFELLSDTDKGYWDTFWEAWGKYGKAFDYYPQSGEATYYTVRCEKLEFKPIRQLYDSGAGTFLWKLSVPMVLVY